jgi:hypothetical protein
MAKSSKNGKITAGITPCGMYLGCGFLFIRDFIKRWYDSTRNVFLISLNYTI